MDYESGENKGSDFGGCNLYVAEARPTFQSGGAIVVAVLVAEDLLSGLVAEGLLTGLETGLANLEAEM